MLKKPQVGQISRERESKLQYNGTYLAYLFVETCTCKKHIKNPRFKFIYGKFYIVPEILNYINYYLVDYIVLSYNWTIALSRNLRIINYVTI